jgi:hypothetical protein
MKIKMILLGFLREPRASARHIPGAGCSEDDSRQDRQGPRRKISRKEYLAEHAERAES